MGWNWFTIEYCGKLWTVRGQSPVGIVAGITGRPRHNWEEHADGSITVWPHDHPARRYHVVTLRGINPFWSLA